MPAPRPEPTARMGPLLRAEGLALRIGAHTVFEDLDFSIGPGLHWVRGGDGRGKTSLLQLLAGTLAPSQGQVHRQASSICSASDAQRGEDDRLTATQWLAGQQARFAHWNTALADGLVQALALAPHIDKSLFMLSTGSRRKLGLVAAFASGAELVLLDTPFAALDGRACGVLEALLEEAAGHRQRAFVLADYTLPATLADTPLQGLIDLGD